jgi:hypothetical protein
VCEHLIKGNGDSSNVLFFDLFKHSYSTPHSLETGPIEAH